MRLEPLLIRTLLGAVDAEMLRWWWSYEYVLRLGWSRYGRLSVDHSNMGMKWVIAIEKRQSVELKMSKYGLEGLGRTKTDFG